MEQGLRMSPNLVKFAGVSHYIDYCIWQHKIAYENGMDASAGRDINGGMHYIQHFLDTIPPSERTKYNPLCEALLDYFLKQTNSHKRLPGVESCALNT